MSDDVLFEMEAFSTDLLAVARVAGPDGPRIILAVSNAAGTGRHAATLTPAEARQLAAALAGGAA